MTDITGYISIVSLIVSIVVGVYVFREMSNTRSKMGEIKFLKNSNINLDSRLLDISKQIKKMNKSRVTFKDDASTSSEEYDVLASSDDDDNVSSSSTNDQVKQTEDSTTT
jgi:hypothetical protein